MKNQYFGDINDYLKYGLLRALASRTGATVAVCWLLTPNDGGNDGRRTGYLQQPDQFRSFDPELFDLLAQSIRADRRAIEEAERHGLIPGAIYHNALLRDDAPSRRSYFESFHKSIPASALVFFDPDNGLEIKSVQMGRKNSSKFLYLDELGAASERGHPLVIYQHFPRVKREEYVGAQVRRIHAVTPAACIAVVATSAVGFFVHANSSMALPLFRCAEAVGLRWNDEVARQGGPVCTVRKFGPAPTP